MSESNVIHLADGIDAVAGRFARRYEPYQQRLVTAWDTWQSTLRSLGTPTRYKGRSFWLPPAEVAVEAATDSGRVIQTIARVGVRGELKHVRDAQRAIRLLQRCASRGVPLLPTSADNVWNTIEAATDTYIINLTPHAPGTHCDVEQVSRPCAPTPAQWARDIDMDGPDIVKFYELRAWEELDTLRSLTALLRPPGYPGPGQGAYDLRATGDTEAGIAF